MCGYFKGILDNKAILKVTHETENYQKAISLIIFLQKLEHTYEICV